MEDRGGEVGKGALPNILRMACCLNLGFPQSQATDFNFSHPFLITVSPPRHFLSLIKNAFRSTSHFQKLPPPLPLVQ